MYANLDKYIQRSEINYEDKKQLMDQASKNPYAKIDGITNLLIIGSDQRPEEQNGHSDAIFIATIDTIHNKLKLISINRDSYVENLNEGLKNQKITNVMYAGGISSLEYAIQENFGINIYGYININFTGLMGLVDALGGIDVDMTEVYNNPATLNELNLFIQNPADDQAFKPSNLIVAPGVQRIDGTQSLAYSRIRKTDTTYARINREDQVITGILDKVVDANITEYPSILQIVGKHVATDIETKHLLSLAYTASQIRNSTIKIKWYKLNN